MKYFIYPYNTHRVNLIYKEIKAVHQIMLVPEMSTVYTNKYEGKIFCSSVLC